MIWDLLGATERWLSVAHCEIWSMSVCRLVVKVSRSGDDSHTVKSSAKEVVSWATSGQSETKKLKIAGESTDP